MKTIYFFVVVLVIFLIPCTLSATVNVTSNDARITWTSGTIYLKAFPGTSSVTATSFTSQRDFDKLSLWLVPSLRQFVDVSTPSLETIQAGRSNTVVLTASVPLGTPLGTYTGTLQIRHDNYAVPQILKIILEVTSPDATVIPSNVAMPTPERLSNNLETGEQFVLGEILLQAKTGVSPESIKALAYNYGGVFLGSIVDLDLYQIQFPAAADSNQLELLIQQLNAEPVVQLATKSWVQTARMFPNDCEWVGTPYPPCQPSALTRAWSGFDQFSYTVIPRYVNLPSAWDISTGSKDTKIAVVDLGFQRDHIDLKDNVESFHDLWINHVPFLGSSVEEHGTAVAGIIGAKGNNGIGLTGVMWDADLMLYAVKIPHINKIYYPSAISAMNDAINNGAKVINYSAGSQSSSQSSTDKVNSDWRTNLLDRQKAKDVVFVFAAGETGVDDQLSSPSSLSSVYDNVISVTSSGLLSDDWTPTNTLDKGANYGNITVAAPGVNVQSTKPTDTYGPETGTSFATPMVSGVAGLIRTVRPDLTAANVKQLIIDGAKAGGQKVVGQEFFILDAYESVLLAKNFRATPGVCAATHYNCSPSTITSTNNVSHTLTWTWSCSNGGITVQCSETKPPTNPTEN